MALQNVTKEVSAQQHVSRVQNAVRIHGHCVEGLDSREHVETQLEREPEIAFIVSNVSEAVLLIELLLLFWRHFFSRIVVARTD